MKEILKNDMQATTGKRGELRSMQGVEQETPVKQSAEDVECVQCASADVESKKQNYEKYVKEMTPVHNFWMQLLKAFLVGGLICVLGQGILNFCTGVLNVDKDTAASLCTIVLILLSVLLTGFNIYPCIVKWGGAGALVPITGFANSVAAPAIEFKKEGWVFGVGCKIFTIAGPVILYGIFTSWVLGVICWIWQFF